MTIIWELLKGGSTKSMDKWCSCIFCTLVKDGAGPQEDGFFFFHDWESKNLDLMSSRKWIIRGLSFDWFRASQIRTARKKFTEKGGGCIEWLMPQHIWRFTTKKQKMIK